MATSADVSRRARDTLAAELQVRGVQRVLIWSRGELEDMLFDPKNDHLLFGFFGISLQVRRRGMVSDLRQRLAKKRQAFKALGDLSNTKTVTVLLRDPTVEGYPWRDRVETFDRDNPPWMLTTFKHHSNPDTVRLIFRRYPAWVSKNRKSYDVLESCSHVGPYRRKDGDEDSDPDHDPELCDRISRFHLTEIPEGQRAWVEYAGWIPLDDVLIIDDLGDAVHDPPHLLITRNHPHGFFTHVRPHLSIERDHSHLRAPEPPIALDELRRTNLFPDPIPQLPQPQWPTTLSSK